MWHKIKNLINYHQNFFLTTHQYPDGDGIGACCALTELLRLMGKKVRFGCDSPIPKKFAFLDYHSLGEEYDPKNDYSDIEVVIVLDTHHKARIGRFANVVDRPEVVSICIDHHEISQTFTENAVIDPTACSVGAMIYQLYKEYGHPLNLNAATGIYTSIICDTGRFSYSSTDQNAHKIAEECIQKGVNPDLMYSHLFQNISLIEIKIFAHALQNMETYLDDTVAIQQISRQDFEKLGEDISELENINLDYIHDFNSLIENIQCFILLRELSDNHVRVSLRSRSNLDIRAIVAKLGGGGHSHAAGISWRGSLQEIKLKILEGLRPIRIRLEGSNPK